MAILAYYTQAMMEHPSDTQFEQMVSTKSFDNCNVQLQDISNSCTISGPNRPNTRCKTTQVQPEQVDPKYVRIPKDFYVLYHFVTLVDDGIFANGIPFLMTSL